MNDQKIIKLLWQRAESAIEALAKKFGNRLMSIAMNILGVRQDAEETVSTVETLLDEDYDQEDYIILDQIGYQRINST